MADQIQAGGSAMLALFEHTWAVGLKEAILNAGGEAIVHEFLDPQALEWAGQHWKRHWLLPRLLR